MAPLRIEVSGEATISRPAERAAIATTVYSEGASQEVVSMNVVSTSARLRKLLESLAEKDSSGQASVNAAITYWSSSSLSTGSRFTYDKEGNKQTRIYNALISFQIRFQDFAKLGPFTTSLSLMEHVSVDSIEWRLTDKTKDSLSSQSRYQAVQDAIRKGEDYAIALGAQTPAVIEIRDQGTSAAQVYTMRAMRATGRESMTNTDPTGAPELSFEPENVALHCSVLVVLERK